MNGFFNAYYLLFISIGFFTFFGTSKKNENVSLDIKKIPPVNIAPILSATGDQIYCPGSSMKIVTNMSIIDPDDSGIDAIYIQISSGYINGQDLLSLTGNHPTISSFWDAPSGKLTLTGNSGQPTYTALIAAIEDVTYTNTSTNPSGTRTFSITVGQANYLPSNGHYYEFVPAIGITWNNARIAAANRTYYGLQGYLATITAPDEAQLSGEQSSGAGWIGGSDEQTEGIWRWMTGPEIGMIFWNGGINGTTPNYANWNNGEPNNMGDEDYAHITALGVGIPGSWNDLSNIGEASGDYQPKGFIVEYGGMPGDPVLQISTSTTITIPSIASITTPSRCGEGTLMLTASATAGTVNWYTTPTGGIPISSGENFITPNLTQTTTYYVDAFEIGCSTGTRIAVTATINQIPIVTISEPNSVCGENATILTASTTAGTINWYASSIGGNSLGSGASFTTPIITEDTIFYVEAVNNGCTSGDRIPVLVEFFELPDVQDETIVLCEGSVVTLNAGISNATYLWSTGENSPSILVNEDANYSVEITSLEPGNCTAVKNFTVIQYDLPIINEVIIQNNSVEIVTIGNGEYEYSIDGINYQSSNVFNVIEGGLYTAFVREKNFICGFLAEKPFVVILVPLFFTPNGDGFNDFFFIKGLEYFPNSSISIFNRFGKFIRQLIPSQPFWDGTLNNENLPADDYWYVLKVDETTPLRKGHFSLKR